MKKLKPAPKGDREQITIPHLSVGYIKTLVVIQIVVAAIIMLLNS